MRMHGAVLIAAAAAAVTVGQSSGTAVPAGGRTHDTAAAVTQRPKERSMPDKALLFFMNPNGRPCQIQKAILDSMQADLDTLARLVYVKTTVGADYGTFSRYGIRSLPSLLVTDNDGRELKRFTPGIQTREKIVQGISAAKAEK